MTHAIVSRKVILPLGIGLLLLLALTHSTTTYAGGSVNISYVGPDNIHLSYSYHPCSNFQSCWGHLEVVVDGHSTTLVDFGTNDTSGTYHHTNLSPDDVYTYRIVEYIPVPDQDPEMSVVTVRDNMSVNGHFFGGTLLFDEKLNGDLLCEDPGGADTNGPIRGVTVPDGINLDVSGATINGRERCTIDVYGQLILDSSTRASHATFNLFKPHSFSNLKHVDLAFMDGSDGSSIQQGQDVTLTVKTDNITIEDVSPAKITLFRPYTFSNLEHVELAFMEGSAGSSVQQSEHVTLTVDVNDVLLQNISKANIRITADDVVLQHMSQASIRVESNNVTLQNMSQASVDIVTADQVTVADVNQVEISQLNRSTNFSMHRADNVTLNNNVGNATLADSKAITLSASIHGKYQISNIEGLKLGTINIADSAIMDISDSPLIFGYSTINIGDNALLYISGIEDIVNSPFPKDVTINIEASAILDVSNSSLQMSNLILNGNGKATFTNVVFNEYIPNYAITNLLLHAMAETEIIGSFFRGG